MISLVIPCHNETQVLPTLFDRITATAEDWHDDWEVILVDDGSSDGTWELIERFHEQNPCWKGIALARNFGHQAAIGAGLEHASGDAVVVLDADLQDPPEHIIHMLEKWHEGYDVVYGVRTRRPEGRLKRACYWLYYRILARVSAMPLPRDAGDFCLMDRRVVDVLCSLREQRPFWRGLRCWAGFRHIGLPYERQQRQAGQSQYSLRKLGKLAMDGLFSTSLLPLRCISYLGVLSTTLLLLAAIPSMLGITTTTAPPLLWAGLFLGSVQLLALGILGEYLGRVYEEVRGRPRWVIAATVGLPPDRDRQRAGGRSLTLAVRSVTHVPLAQKQH